MDDSDDNVCPLCCEELDISDQQFFPCKCGYQVCMWCWHRIRESESGLCPACRTPYGDDPHEFSAVDVADVLKANKEKAAAEKRQRERLREENERGGTTTSSNNNNNEAHQYATAPSTFIGQMDVPKDRSQLANMRVIRRNLVYAVGLPPSIATEDMLRKPEYFGQYGKIAKIVLNRTNVTSSDPRRASASAYVTFVHKEDTLACILALDGFFMDGRNIRASYGTSKYCSAFVKNVRCNNPDCTYLHHMGDTEDTFTKQEIQAGYVTSGRDVLARQQQIVAEQLSMGNTGAGTRRKVGGGGPSGTGKASANPVFPPPVYDEPIKQQSTTTTTTTTTSKLPAPVSRSKSVGGASAAATPPVAPTAAKISRSVSMSSGSASPAVATSTRKASLPSAPVATAASVVAGMHSIGNTTSVEPSPAAHTTLTPLTPLKRTSKKSSHDADSKRDSMTKLSSLRNGGKSSSLKNGLYSTAAPPSPSSSSGKAMASQKTSDFSVGSIGGTALGPPGSSAVGGSSLLGPRIDHAIGNGSGALGGQPIGGGTSNDPFSTSSSALGGEIFTGQLPPRSDSAIGNHNDKWNSAAPVDRGSGLFGSSSSLSIGGGDIWGNEASGGMSSSVGGGRAPAAGVIGGNNSSLGSIGPASDSGLGPGGHFGSNSGSSALASMLGINLPTGTGSLRESSTLWNGPSSSSQAPSSVASLNGSSAPGVIGSANRAPGGGMPTMGGGGGSGGMPTSGFQMNASVPSGGSGGNTSSDIALLQSLLPGVHITSGNAKQPAAPSANQTGGTGTWNPMAGAPINQSIGNHGGGFGLSGQAQGESWGGAPVGSNNGRMTGQGGRQQEQNQSGIW